MSDRDYRSIGRLVRSCSLIEDACHSYLGWVSKASGPTLTILLGQTGFSKKLALAETFAALRGAKETERFKRLFDLDRIREVFKCRNAVSHGFLLGQWPNGLFAFETTIASGSNEDGMASIVTYSFGSDDIALYADWAEELAAQASHDLYILEQRRERQQQSLLPSGKSQPKPKRARSRPQPQKPSQG